MLQHLIVKNISVIISCLDAAAEFTDLILKLISCGCEIPAPDSHYL